MYSYLYVFKKFNCTYIDVILNYDNVDQLITN